MLSVAGRLLNDINTLPSRCSSSSSSSSSKDVSSVWCWTNSTAQRSAVLATSTGHIGTYRQYHQGWLFGRLVQSVPEGHHVEAAMCVALSKAYESSKINQNMPTPYKSRKVPGLVTSD
jgi:hypothetical protein